MGIITNLSYKKSKTKSQLLKPKEVSIKNCKISKLE